MMLRAARRALHATRRQLSTSTDALPKVPKPPTAALAKRSQLSATSATSVRFG